MASLKIFTRCLYFDSPYVRVRQNTVQHVDILINTTQRHVL